MAVNYQSSLIKSRCMFCNWWKWEFNETSKQQTKDYIQLKKTKRSLRMLFKKLVETMH